MYEEKFGDKTYRAVTRRASYQSLDGPQIAVFFTVTVDGRLFYEYDPETEPPQTEEEAVKLSIAEAKKFLAEQARQRSGGDSQT